MDDRVQTKPTGGTAWRKAVGVPLILVFLIAYAVVVVTIGERLPSHWAIQGLYFLIAGTAWGAPLFPLLSWMDKGPQKTS